MDNSSSGTSWSLMKKNRHTRIHINIHTWNKNSIFTKLSIAAKLCAYSIHVGSTMLGCMEDTIKHGSCLRYLQMIKNKMATEKAGWFEKCGVWWWWGLETAWWAGLEGTQASTGCLLSINPKIFVEPVCSNVVRYWEEGRCCFLWQGACPQMGSRTKAQSTEKH